MQKIIPKKDLDNLLKKWMRSYEVVAPVKEKNTKFKKINSPEEIYFHALTEVTAKSHFMPENETLLKFEKNKIEENQGKIKKTIIFGMRKCDLNAIDVIDKVMYDVQYQNKRKNTILVGLFCEHPDKFCFCNSMDLKDFHDLFFYPKGDKFIIDVGSKKGEELVKDLPDLKKEIKIPNPKNIKKLSTLDISKDYRNALWEGDANKCLSCSACTMDCPTCNCFNISEETELDKTGRTKRNHASCMTKSFSRLAGGKSVRDSRLSRFKHFVYHKIVYYKMTKGRPMCVGCGRCLRVCPTHIDWVETINKINKEKKKK